MSAHFQTQFWIYNKDARGNPVAGVDGYVEIEFSLELMVKRPKIRQIAMILFGHAAYETIIDVMDKTMQMQVYDVARSEKLLPVSQAAGFLDSRTVNGLAVHFLFLDHMGERSGIKLDIEESGLNSLRLDLTRYQHNKVGGAGKRLFEVAEAKLHAYIEVADADDRAKAERQRKEEFGSADRSIREFGDQQLIASFRIASEAPRPAALNSGEFVVAEYTHAAPSDQPPDTVSQRIRKTGSDTPVDMRPVQLPVSGEIKIQSARLALDLPATASLVPQLRVTTTAPPPAAEPAPMELLPGVVPSSKEFAVLAPTHPSGESVPPPAPPAPEERPAPPTDSGEFAREGDVSFSMRDPFRPLPVRPKND